MYLVLIYSTLELQKLTHGRLSVRTQLKIKFLLLYTGYEKCLKMSLSIEYITSWIYLCTSVTVAKYLTSGDLQVTEISEDKFCN